jgi:hypothetical protein
VTRHIRSSNPRIPHAEAAIVSDALVLIGSYRSAPCAAPWWENFARAPQSPYPAS